MLVEIVQKSCVTNQLKHLFSQTDSPWEELSQRYIGRIGQEGRRAILFPDAIKKWRIDVVAKTGRLLHTTGSC